MRSLGPGLVLVLVPGLVLGVSVLAACAAKTPAIQADPAIVAPSPSPPPERKEREHYLGMAVPEHEPVPFPNINGECEPGQVRLCPNAHPVASGLGREPTMRLKMHCDRWPDGSLHFDRSDCATPLVVVWGDARVEFVQPVETAASFGVGPFERTEWATARTPWLAMDRDGSGCIEDQGELFRHGELAVLDDDGDGYIDERDAAYERLVLWSDRDSDRRCQPSELTTLRAAGLTRLSVRFAAGLAHPFGSHEGEVAAMEYRDPGGALRTGRIVDVYLAPSVH